MKKLLLLSLLLNFTLIKSSLAQTNLHVAIGSNYSNYEYKGYDQLPTSWKTGYFIEVAPNFQLSEKLKLVINGQYSLKGYDRDDVSPVLTQIRFSFFDIIPELEYQILEFLDIGIGAHYGFKIKEEHRFEDDNWEPPNFGIEHIKSSDFGITTKVKLNYKKAFGFVRYNIGLNNLTDFSFTDNQGQVVTGVTQKSRNLQVGFGYNFSL